MAHIAIVGATGNVGRQMLNQLEEQKILVDKVTLYASEKSAGQRAIFKGQEIVVEELNKETIDATIDYALFSAGTDVALKYAPYFNEKGIRVIDNSSAYRQEDSVPLVVPEVNKADLSRRSLLIANPNCSTIQAVIPLYVMQTLFGLKRVTYSTYQAVSGSGQAGVKALEENNQGKEQTFYPKPIAGNVIPHIDAFLANGYTKEEQKMMDETRKILDLPTLNVSATCVRVPVQNGHGVSVSVECQNAVHLERLLHALTKQEGLVVMDTPDYPTPIEVNGKNQVYIGRVRHDQEDKHTVHFWCVADNLRKGAATNAVQILNYLMEEKQ